jgi:hypothetical protein
MALTRIVLRLARNLGFPEGDDSQGYLITAPLDRNGRIDIEEWRRERNACTVIRLKPGEERDADGRLTHRGGQWFVHYDEEGEGDDEPLYRLGDHALVVGGYVTIHESNGQDLTYQVVQHLQASAGISPVHDNKASPPGPEILRHALDRKL